MAGARAGIDIISTNVDMADPIATTSGTGAAEVPKLIAFVSEQTGLSEAEVVAALQENFPHTTALLQAIPLSSVSAEFPALFAFLEKTLNVSEAELLAALQARISVLELIPRSLYELFAGAPRIAEPAADLYAWIDFGSRHDCAPQQRARPP